MFGKFQLTNKGRDLLNRVIAEKKILKFTKFELGKGQPGMDTKELTALNNKFADFQVTQTSVLTDGITNIKGFYDNKALVTPSKLTEIGVFAQIQDEPLSEVLFSYTSQLDDDAETIPSRESYFSRTFSVMNKTDNATNVTFDLTIRQDKYNFGTLAEMKSADYLEVGDKCVLWGGNSLGDQEVEFYIITEEIQDIQLDNTLYAKENVSLKKIKQQLDGKVKKVGDTMTGTLKIDNNSSALFNVAGTNADGGFGHNGGEFIGIINRKSNKQFRMNNDGTTNLPAENIKVYNKKDVIEALNYAYNKEGKGSYRIDGQGSLDSLELLSGTYFYNDFNTRNMTGSQYGYLLSMRYTENQSGTAQLLFGDVSSNSDIPKIFTRIHQANGPAETKWFELYHSGNLNPQEILVNSTEVMVAPRNDSRRTYTLTQPLSDKYNFINIQFSDNENNFIRIVRYPMKLIQYGVTNFGTIGIGATNGNPSENGQLKILSKTQVEYYMNYIDGTNQSYVTKIWQSYV